MTSFSEQTPILKEGRLYRLKQSQNSFYEKMSTVKNKRPAFAVKQFFYDRGTILMYLGVLDENPAIQTIRTHQYFHAFLDPDANVVGVWEVWHYLRSDEGSSVYETVNQQKAPL